MSLTERQKQDLNKSIAEYLLNEGDKFSKTLELFKEEAGIGNDIILDLDKCILEKKWTSVIRLQKKIMDLEMQLSTLQLSNKTNCNNTDNNHNNISSSSSSSSSNNNESRSLPRGPAKSTLSGHRLPILSISTHPIFSLTATGSEDATIKIWDYETNQYERTLKGHTGPVNGVCFDTTGKYLASCSTDTSAKIWDMTTYACTKSLRGHDHTVSSIQFLSSGDHVLTCSRDNTLKTWNINTGYCVRTFCGHLDWVRTLSISLDGEYLASGGSDQNIIIWRIENGQNVTTLRGHEHVIETLNYGKKPVIAADILSASSLLLSNSTSSINQTGDISEEYSYLASGSRDKTVKLWDPLKGQLLMTFDCHENWVRSIIIHPTGKFIISCSDDKTIRVLDVKDEGRCLRTITDAHKHFVSCISYSLKNSILVSGSVDKNLNIWYCK